MGHIRVRVQVDGGRRTARLRCNSGVDSGTLAESQQQRHSVWFHAVGGTGLSRHSTFLARWGDSRDTTTHPILGLLVGNFSRGEDAAFLRSLPLRAEKGDTLLLGLDHESDPARIHRAYNNRGSFRDPWHFNGLKGAGSAMGVESLFAPEKWECVSRYDEEKRRRALLGSV